VLFLLLLVRRLFSSGAGDCGIVLLKAMYKCLWSTTAILLLLSVPFSPSLFGGIGRIRWDCLCAARPRRRLFSVRPHLCPSFISRWFGIHWIFLHFVVSAFIGPSLGRRLLFPTGSGPCLALPQTPFSQTPFSPRFLYPASPLPSNIQPLIHSTSASHSFNLLSSSALGLETLHQPPIPVPSLLLIEYTWCCAIVGTFPPPPQQPQGPAKKCRFSQGPAKKKIIL
jgi:hypothetical protein